MIQSKHTPGPWHTDGECGNIFTAYYDGQLNGYLATVSIDGLIANTRSDRKQEGLANARLIAAAPDLLEALKIILVQYGDDDRDNSVRLHTINIVKAAITKAEGGA